MTILENRQITVTTPLGPEKLFFERMTAAEHLGRPFDFDLELIGPDADIDFKQLLGQHATVAMDMPDGGTRHFDGLVSRFVFVGMVEGFARYRATLRPWFWFLSHTADCRIFQKKTVPQILSDMFSEQGFSGVFETTLQRTYRTREYCVQYRETTFDFLSRLMEEEGIYYYFKHEAGRHVMVLADSVSGHAPYPGFDEVPYFPPEDEYRRRQDHVWEWQIAQEVRPGKVVLDDFDFTTSRADLIARAASPGGHALDQGEVYDYPGGYPNQQGDPYAQARMEALAAEFERLSGRGNARMVAAGRLFTLQGYDREDQNREYLTVSTEHRLEMKELMEGSPEGHVDMHAVRFVAIPSQRPFRSPATTRRPVIRGPQTAFVVGRSGDEITTDEYGRIKVQFHWDRRGASDENSSCFLRVAQSWAGAQWGGFVLPRVGQEVLVEFLEGDPDRPIVTGCVYNDLKKPPYDPRSEGTKSTFKSNSSKGGGGFNEFRFEDKKGDEEVYLHAQKDMKVEILHDETVDVKNNRTVTIADGNDSLTLTKGDQTITLSAGKSTVTAQTSIELKVGANSIKLDQRGITIKGLVLSIEGTTTLDAKSPATTVKGDGALVLQGGVVKIN